MRISFLILFLFCFIEEKYEKNKFYNVDALALERGVGFYEFPGGIAAA